MLLFLQAITLIGLSAVTYLLFVVIGPRRTSLLYSRQDKKDWDASMGSHIAPWLTLTNIVGTLTSLATTYLFFIGSSKLFGLWSLTCSITIFLGSFVTNSITLKILAQPRMKQLFESNEQRVGAIAILFWSPTLEGRRVAQVAKVISILNISAVIWLEFSFFADLSGRLIGISSYLGNAIILAVTAMIVFDFIIRYGLRGVVFADALHAPLIVVGVLGLICGCVLLYLVPLGSVNEVYNAWYIPSLSIHECILFAFHVVCLNSFLVVATEPHWLRVWAFRNRETSLQVVSQSVTAVIWLLLMAIGFFAYYTTGKVGDDAIVGLLSQLSKVSPIFIMLFWLGGIAALFSTSDAQIYSLLLVNEFDSSSGELKNQLMGSIRPGAISFLSGTCFGVIYWLVRSWGLPFEKIIFVVIPLSLNLVPSLFLAAFNRRQSVKWPLLSFGLYLIAAIYGFILPADNFWATLLAGLMPIFVSIAALLCEHGGAVAEPGQQACN